jgi:hypothetical protein
MVTFDEIQDAFSFVSSNEYGMNRVLLCLDNGEIYYHSENGDFDELDEDEFDCDNFVVIPHKNDLDLGQRLVFDFAEQHLADELDHRPADLQQTGSLQKVQRLPGAEGPPSELV